MKYTSPSRLSAVIYFLQIRLHAWIFYVQISIWPQTLCALEELRALLHIYYRAINLRNMYCTGEPFLFLLGRATYIEFSRASYGPGLQGLCIFPCSLLNHNQSTHTKKVHKNERKLL